MWSADISHPCCQGLVALTHSYHQLYVFPMPITPLSFWMPHWCLLLQIWLSKANSSWLVHPLVRDSPTNCESSFWLKTASRHPLFGCDNLLKQLRSHTMLYSQQSTTHYKKKKKKQLAETNSRNPQDTVGRMGLGYGILPEAFVFTKLDVLQALWLSWCITGHW